MSFAIVSPHSPSFRRVSAMTIPNKKEYADRWGISLETPDYPNEKIFNDHGWGRIDFMQEYLQKYDWILFMGADALFMNFKIDARAFCIPHYELLAAWDWNGLQSDVMFIQNCRSVHKALDQVRARKEKDISKPGLAGSDQGALVTVLSGREEYENNCPASSMKRLVKVSQLNKFVNRYDDEYLPGDFIYHAVGGRPSLLSHIENKEKLIKYHLPLVLK